MPKGIQGFQKGQPAWNTGKKCIQFSGKNNHFWNGGKIKVICLACNRKFYVKLSRIKRGEGKYCSCKCYHKHFSYKPTNGSYKKGQKHPEITGKLHHNWKGGRKIHGEYIRIRRISHPFATNGYVLEHRLVVEKQIGRYLLPKEKCHHINKKKDDNRPQNLMAFVNQSVHIRFESGKKVKPEEIIFDSRKLIQ